MSGNIIRAPNHLGDCVMALAALQALPDGSHYHLLAPHWSEPLYHRLPGAIPHWIETPHLHGISAIRHQCRMVRKVDADRGLLLTPSFSSALIFALGGVKERFGFVSDGRGFLLNHPVDSQSAPKHRAERYRLLLETFFDIRLRMETPRIPASQDAVAVAEKQLEQNGFSKSARFIVIAAQAVAESRRWGTANYAALALQLIDTCGHKIILLGTETEWPAGQEIRGIHPDIINLCGQTDLRTAGAVLSRAELFIGNDSGLAHLAGAVGIPVVVLSGADNPQETSPLAAKKTVIIKDNLECISCVKNYCPLSEDKYLQCMKQITVEEVFNAAAGYLS